MDKGARPTLVPGRYTLLLTSIQAQQWNASLLLKMNEALVTPSFWHACTVVGLLSVLLLFCFGFAFL